MNEKAKAKAKQILDSYKKILPFGSPYKRCAKIALDEILNLNCVWYEKDFAESKNLDIESTKEFWQSVLKAI